MLLAALVVDDHDGLAHLRPHLKGSIGSRHGPQPSYLNIVLIWTEPVNAAFDRTWFVAIRRPKRPDNRFFRSNEQSSVRTLREKGIADGS